MRQMVPEARKILLRREAPRKGLPGCVNMTSRGRVET